MIYEFISEICGILNISIPKISYDTSTFNSATMMAQCNTDGSTIFLKKYDKINPDLLFSIAHEIRHIWQIKTGKEIYFDNYQTIDTIKDTEKYNLQIAELDANAFAKIVMCDFFHITPLFNGLSDNVKNEIDKRVDTIISEKLF